MADTVNDKETVISSPVGFHMLVNLVEGQEIEARTSLASGIDVVQEYFNSAPVVQV